jgi:hypothetical protein
MEQFFGEAAVKTAVMVEDMARTA